MTVRKTKLTLAKTVNAQVNPNLAKREDWANCDKALSDGDKSYASSTFTKTKYIKSYKTSTTKDKNGKAVTTKTPVYDSKHNHPYVLSAHKFQFDIPSNAYIKDIKFYVRMKATGVSSVASPMCRFDVYGNAFANKKDENKAVNTTGWDDGLYYQKLSSKISSSWKTYTYSMSEAETKKAKVRAKHINAEVFGIDLLWYDAVFKGDLEAYKDNKNATGHIYVAWVKCIVEYEIPEYKITYSVPSTKTNPIDVPSGNNLYITATYKQSTNGYGGTQVLDMTLPWGTELVGTPSASAGSSFNKSTMKWTVPADGKHTNTLDFVIKSYVRGINNLSIGNDAVGDFPCYYQTSIGLTDGYDDLLISLDGEVHKNHRACAYVSIDGYSEDTTATYYVHQPTGLSSIEWSFINGSDGVSLDDADDNSITLNVPQNERFQAYLRVCFVATSTGNKTLTVKSDDTGHTKAVTFSVQDPYTYHITSKATDSENSLTLSTAVLNFTNHRVASETETQAVVLPFYADEFDSYMTQSKSSLKLEKWEQLDYIGCIPLEHLHFDPKSTYKDKLLDTHYKNKRYMGKELASDEDITLNVRLHPQQVTTLQGLIDMDKPIPINTNHLIWEGDSLNHRGWAEIYGLKVEQTGNNPHWYKCEVDVKYLTHNLHTRFHIQRGSEKVNTQPVSDLMSEVFALGDSLSDTDFFSTTTDGTYMYNEDDEIVVDYLDENDEEVIWDGTQAVIDDFEANGYVVVNPTINQPIQVLETIDVPPAQRNVFSIDNGQNIDIISKDSLGTVSEVVLDWSSTVLDEYRENHIEKVIELLDENDEPVFKYQYNELEFEYDYTDDTPVIESISANPIAYVRKDGAWIDDTEEVTLRIDVESGIDSDITYGSRLHFQLDNHRLRVIDEGFNGREWEIANIELEGQNYKWHTRWVNKNDDGETNDVMAFIGLSVNNTVFDSQFADKYGRLVVSPFPVADKKLLFTREAEEGTIYYYEDSEDSEFSYMIEPYYQYHNGCDLQSDTGISIFNLNYGYEIVYIQNGLVRLGFDRVSEKGRLFLGKYDPTSDTYITTNTFRFDKYADINLKSISDDKIEIQASDTIFTIYRGHPYILINHSDEDIWIDTRFTRVWGEKVGAGDFVEYPTYWDLMNNANILPSCVGGIKEIKSSCIEVDTRDDAEKASTSLSWATGTVWNDVEVSTDKTVTLSSDNVSLSDVIDVGTGHCDFGDYSFEIGHDYSVVESVSLISDGIIEDGATGRLTARVDGYEYTPLGDKSVSFYENVPQKFEWYNSGTSQWITVITDDTGTTFANNTNENRWIWANQIGTSSDAYDWNSPFVIEFDVVSRTGENTIIYGGTTNSNVYRNFYQLDITGNNHIRIVGMEDMVYFYTDGELKYSESKDSAKARFGFRISPNESFKFKNAKIIASDKVYPITDTLFSDTGVTGSANPNWYDNNYGTVSVGSDGTLLTSSDTTNFLMHNASNSSHTSSDQYIWNAPFVVEFDVVSMSGTGTDTQFQVYSNETTKNWATGLSGTGHYKAIVLEGNQRLYKDGELQTNFQSYSLPNCRITLRVRNNVSLKYKNFKVYEIAENSITDSNGIATATIVGDGTGVKEYIAISDGVESNTASVVDGVVRVEVSKDNIEYPLNKANHMNIIVDGNKFDITTNTSQSDGSYSGLYWSGSNDPNPLSIMKGKSFTALIKDIEFEESGGANWNIKVYQKINNGSWINIINSDNISDGDNSVDFSVDSNASHLWVRIQPSNNNRSYHIRTGEWVIYPIESETPTPSTITLSSNKSILSAYDSETATLTVNVKDSDNQGVTGQTVEIYKGNTKLGNATDNNDGTYSYTYNANGDGDIVLTAQTSGLTSSAVNIEDCLHYDPMTSNSGNWINSNSTSHTASFSSNGMSLTSSTSSARFYMLNQSFTKPVSFEFTIVSATSTRLGLRVADVNDGNTSTNDWINCGYYFGSYSHWRLTVQNQSNVDNTTNGFNDNDVIKLSVTNDTVYLYCNDTLIAQKSHTLNIGLYFGFLSLFSNTRVIKDVKVKAL